MLRDYPIPCPRTPKFEMPPCDHAMYVFFKKNGNGTTYWNHCFTCGHKGKRVLKSELSDDIIKKALRISVYEEYWEQKREHAKLQWKKENDKAFDEWYSGYMKSPEWAERRRLVIKRCGGVCECCMNGKAVQAHHKTYALVGREPLYHLVGVCIECHDFLSENGHGISWQR